MKTINNKRLRICVIENGLVPDELAGSYASYPQMVNDWLGNALPEAEFFMVSAVKGEPMPDADSYDGYVLTGSKFSVYDNIDWIHRLRTFIQDVGSKRIPIFGICFGHQLMAEAFGGSTRKAKQGWGIGAQPYCYNLDEVQDGSAFVFHQDQVITLPSSAQVAGGSDHCPYGALKYDFPALSVQYHPEFTADYIHALAELYGGSTFSHEMAQDAKDSLKNQIIDNKGVAIWAAKLFRGACS